MAWQSSLWARWLGWTALYALVLVGAAFFTVRLALYINPSGLNYPEWLTTLAWVLAVLVPVVLAFGIGVRFRSWWWGLGPLVLCGVLLAAMFIDFWIRSNNGSLQSGEEVALVFAAIGLPMIAGVLSLVALAGVWWGKRRHAANARPLEVSSGADASTLRMR